MEISWKDINRITDLMFNEPNFLYKMHYESFYHFIRVIIHDELNKQNIKNLDHYVDSDKILHKHYFEFSDITLSEPVNEEGLPMSPNEARIKNMTYAGNLRVTVKQFHETLDSTNGEIINKKLIGEDNRVIGKIPIMVRSDFCTTRRDQDARDKECKYDPGCYFIINGNEKIILSHEKMVENKIFTVKSKKYAPYETMINSRKDTNNSIQIKVKLYSKKGAFKILPKFSDEIPLFIILKAFGIVNEQSIYQYILQSEYSIEDFYSKLQKSYDDLKNTKIIKDNKQVNIESQEDALLYLASKINNRTKFIDKEDDQQKITVVKNILVTDFLSHLNKDYHPSKIDNLLRKKGIFICEMVRQLILTMLGNIEPTYRDNYENKRVELTGVLLSQVFKSGISKMMKECRSQFRNKRNTEEDTIPNVINYIKISYIENEVKSSINNGSWGSLATSKKGVSQSVERLTYTQLISACRKIKNPISSQANTKVVKVRYVTPSQYGFVCPIESPEGKNIGILKSFAALATVTFKIDKQDDICRRILEDKLYKIEESNPLEMSSMCKVYVNGDLIGLAEDMKEIYNFLKEQKFNQVLDYRSSVYKDVKLNAVHFSSDGSRFIRPVLRIKDNKFLLTKEMVNRIVLRGEKSNIKNPITNLNQFMEEYPGVIEYIDPQESLNCVIAENPQKIYQNKKYQDNPVPKVKGNRYADGTYYLNYTHCEFHPTYMLGPILSNTPLINHNEAPRNSYNYSQTKHGIGIPITNFKSRFAISYKAMTPQKAVLITSNAKNYNTDILPYGENIVVALMCYGGYNQEDSVIINKTSVERGRFRVFSYKIYKDTVVKNQTSGRDDIFMKPDPNNVTGMKKTKNNYSKLNNQGYIPEGTYVEKNDIIIGKVSPVISSEGENILTDSSITYNSNIPGIVEKVYKGKDYNKYDIIKIKVRQERILMVGDKMCSRAAQKGTVGALIPEEEMPISENGIIPDLILNPNCMPSRMTISQIFEMIASKAGVLDMKHIDGTPFEKVNMLEMEKTLEDNGFDKHGLETLYCGYTGKRMETKIYMGPTHYMRLKHLALDKLHGRSTGKIKNHTRQPNEGRANDGGNKFGYMEKDCMVSHGASKFLNEKFMKCSDEYEVHICNKCGDFASASGSKKLYYICYSCKSSSYIKKIRIPYCAKLFKQEARAAGMDLKLKTY